MDLAVQKREFFGKQVKSLRRQGLIPAELYGPGIENLHLSVAFKDLRAVLKESGGTGIVNIHIRGETGLPGGRQAMIYEIARHPLSEEILSVAFYQVRLDEKIKVKVPVEFTGEPPAIKSKGGILVKTLQEVEVEALPGKIPSVFSVDLGGLEAIGQSIHVHELKLDKDVTIITDPETVLAIIKEPAAEEEAPPAEEKLTVESVVVESEVKKKKRESEKRSEKQSEKPEEQK